MYKVSVVEKILGQVVVNTYSFPREDQMLLFKQMCEEDGDLVIDQTVMTHELYFYEEANTNVV